MASTHQYIVLYLQNQLAWCFLQHVKTVRSQNMSSLPQYNPLYHIIRHTKISTVISGPLHIYT